MANERREFFRSLSKKSEYERPAHGHAFLGLYLRACGSDFHVVFTEDRYIQSTLIKVEFGSFGALPSQVARAS